MAGWLIGFVGLGVGREVWESWSKKSWDRPLELIIKVESILAWSFMLEID